MRQQHIQKFINSYIERQQNTDHDPDEAEDSQRYQTVFARSPGAVAAPTAALHFDEGVLAELQSRGIERASVTLHVGAGTFQPVKTENLAEHQMHSEWYEVPLATLAALERCRQRGGRVHRGRRGAAHGRAAFARPQAQGALARPPEQPGAALA